MIDILILKKNSLIHDNVDNKILKVILNRSKDLYLSPILGDSFYNHLNTAVLNGDETTLVNEYIYPFITVSTEIMASKHINWEIRNKSTGVSNDVYQRANSWQENDKLINDLLNQAQLYKTKLIAYLLANKNLFPLYKDFCKPDLGGNSYSTQMGFISNRKTNKR